MLVLSRQRDETIMIGNEVEITIVDVRGDKVRLGITAPARVAVHRKEVYQAIQSENLAAAVLGENDLAQVKPKLPTPGPNGTAPILAPRPTPAKASSKPTKKVVTETAPCALKKAS